MDLKRWFRPNILRMQGYVPGEQPTSPEIIKLNTNESPYPPPRAVLTALRNSAGALLRKYPPPDAEPLRRRLSRLFRWPADGFLVGNGSDEILAMLFRACVGKGDLVQYPDVTYSLYPVLNRMSEGRERRVRLDASFDLSFKRLSPRARLTLLAYPNPPLGNCFDRGEILRFCRRARGLVLIDEAYVDFADGDCTSIARKCPNVLILRTLSKSFSLAGARLGYALGHLQVIRQLLKVKDSYNVSRMALAIGLGAFSPEGLSTMRRNIRAIRAERTRLTRELGHLGFRVPESRANFLTAFMPRACKRAAASGLYRALKDKGILVRYFSHERLKNALRITVGSPAENDRLLKELKQLIDSFATKSPRHQGKI